MAARPTPTPEAPLKEPKNFDQLYPGRFLKAGTLDGKKVTMTITEVKHERLEGEKGLEIKAIMSFAEREMQLVLAKTNAICIKAMFGPILASWKGKRITLVEGKVEVSGPMKGQPCIRLWGSPDIAQDMVVAVKLPKRKPFDAVMHHVDVKGQPSPSPAPSPAPPPEAPVDAPDGVGLPLE